jgi:hypothetical protein
VILSIRSPSRNRWIIRIRHCRFCPLRSMLSSLSILGIFHPKCSCSSLPVLRSSTPVSYRASRGGQGAFTRNSSIASWIDLGSWSLAGFLYRPFSSLW